MHQPASPVRRWKVEREDSPGAGHPTMKPSATTVSLAGKSGPGWRHWGQLQGFQEDAVRAGPVCKEGGLGHPIPSLVGKVGRRWWCPGHWWCCPVVQAEARQWPITTVRHYGVPRVGSLGGCCSRPRAFSQPSIRATYGPACPRSCTTVPPWQFISTIDPPSPSFPRPQPCLIDWPRGRARWCVFCRPRYCSPALGPALSASNPPPRYRRRRRCHRIARAVVGRAPRQKERETHTHREREREVGIVMR